MTFLARFALALMLAATAQSAKVCSLSGGCFDRDAVDLTIHAGANKSKHKQLWVAVKTHQPASDPKAWDAQAPPGPGAISTPGAMMWASFVVAILFAVSIAHKTKGLKEAEPAFDKYLAEFLGTYLLVFSYGCNTIVGDTTWGVAANAFTLMAVMYALGRVSDANFNPAVSLAMGLSDRISMSKVFIYSCIQFAAGISGGLTYGLLFKDTFNLAPVDGHRWWQAGIAEMLYTFMLCFVFLNTVSLKTKGKNEYYGLAVGFTVIAGGYGAGGVSMGCFNPAIAFAIDSSSSSLGPGWFAAYFVFEMFGAILAAVLFRVCRPGEFLEKSSESPSTTEGAASAEAASEDAAAAPPATAESSESEAEVTSDTSELVSEFLGTYMLVLTIGLNVLVQSKAREFSAAASLMCMIFALVSCSGTHFNPAVTLAVVCAGRNKISAEKAMYYVGAQIVGAACATVTFMLVMDGKAAHLIPGGAATTKALIGELAFTFLLCYVFLAVATTESRPSQYFGFVIGGCVLAGGQAIGSLSGGILNPAVSFGMGLSEIINGGSFEHFFTFTAVQFLGGGAASLMFFATHAAEYGEKLEGCP